MSAENRMCLLALTTSSPVGSSWSPCQFNRNGECLLDKKRCQQDVQGECIRNSDNSGNSEQQVDSKEKN